MGIGVPSNVYVEVAVYGDVGGGAGGDGG